MAKTIIVGNRLPVKIHDEGGQLLLKPSEGGLATGLSSVHSSGPNLWIGWPGMAISEDQQEKITGELKERNLIPIFLSEEEINNFYEGFSNETLWPVFHYMSTYAKFDPAHWRSYQDVNRKFCETVLQYAEPGDVIWIHDYQLLLLPGMIRNERPDATIGFFQHIPFPSYEIFRLIPWRKELLNGIMGADLIGFHTYDDVRHFLSTVTHLLPIRSSANIITSEERTIVVESFPMGIDVAKFEQSVQSDTVQQNIQTLKETFPDVQLILSIDRLDYSKGIIQRLQGFDTFLTEHSQYIGKVALYMIIVPSRDTVPQYHQLRNDIDQLVGNINGRYRTVDWVPVHYFYRSFDFETLVSLYATADVCLVTPMRDGMNLVCKEYIACRINNTGVLILSEMAGASKELIESIIVNPNDIKEISAALVEALTMQGEEQERRMKQLRQVISKFNITQWVKNFMERLNEVKELQNSMKAKLAGPITEKYIKAEFLKAQKRVLFLDYDGTLVGFKVRVEQAYPDKELYDILNSLIADSANKIVIVSGRNHTTLEEWFGQLPIDFIAEHGAWMKFHGREWETVPNLTDEWKKEIYPVLNLFTDRTPGTFVEEKSFSLVWHYRKADEGLGELRANELTSNLRYMAADKGLQILPGNKVIEVKNIEVNKGRAVNNWLSHNEADVILAIGDDHTDEDIFKALPETAITIKVGSNISSARFYLHHYPEVRKLLISLAGLA